MKTLTRLSGSFFRKLHTKTISEARISSFPFVSGDTFRSYATDVFFRDQIFDRVIQKNSKTHSIIFTEVDELLRPDSLLTLRAEISRRLDSSGVQPRVIIHNGDNIISQDYLELLVSAGALVYAVNSIEPVEGVTPIPIGLENAHIGVNGRLENFLAYRHHQIAPQPRELSVLSAFNTHTNPSIRENLAQLISKSRHRNLNTRLSPNEFQQYVLRSKFVLSPPGNGPDCHRTWESIYLGAVPVVLRSHFPRSLISGAPIWAVDDWDEIIALSDDQLDQKYVEIMKVDATVSEFDYWVKELTQ